MASQTKSLSTQRSSILIGGPPPRPDSRGTEGEEEQANHGHWITRMHMNLSKFVFEDPEKTVGEERMDEMATKIRTYRGVQDAEEEEEASVLWVDSLPFDIAISVVIILNTVAISIEVDYADPDKKPDWYWWVIEGVFCAIFLLEVVLKMCYHGWRWIVFDAWNFLTVAIAAVTLVDAAVLNPLQVHGSLKAITLIRVLGLVRLRQAIRHFRWLAGLRQGF
mmetsp:Transcript_66933/g.189885  ORF Transcript_66933/g.189885 Transcript_66933/m.189885 type:complete len:221 (-) Transcript_66933:22-684(-)